MESGEVFGSSPRTGDIRMGLGHNVLSRNGLAHFAPAGYLMVICIGRVCGVVGVGEISVSGSGTSMGDFDIGCF